MLRGIQKSIAFALIAALVTPPSLAQDPTPTPSPTVTESGDLEGQKKSLERAKERAESAEDSAKVSMAVFGVAAGVCIAACVLKWTGAAESACYVGGVLALAHDVYQVIDHSKRWRNGWKELVGAGGGALVAVGADYAMVAGLNAISTTQYQITDSCVAAAALTGITIAKQIPIKDFKDAKNKAAAELAALNGDGSATRLSLSLEDIGDARVNAVEGTLRGSTLSPAVARPNGAVSRQPSSNAATACSSFALNKDVRGAANCLTQQGEKLPNNFTSPEFAKLFEKASGADLGQALKSGVGEGATAESILKKATANISGIDRSKFADLVAAMNGSIPKGGGGASGRRFASNGDDDRTAVLRNDSADAMRFADPAPIDTTLFGRASAQYMRFTKKKYFEMP